jgi:peptidyl-prolyl cis-trans isomerase D
MLGYLRGKRTSKIVLGFVALVMLAFTFAGVEYKSGFQGFGGASDDTIAKVGDRRLHAADVRQRIENLVRRAQMQNPDASTAMLVAQGAYEPLIDSAISAMALDAYGRSQGLAAGKRLVDAQIASIPDFQLGGNFDESTFRYRLSQLKMGEDQLRRELAGDVIRRQLLDPVDTAPQMPLGVASLYVSVLLESREGLIGIVPTAAMHADGAPSDAEIQDYYKKNVAHYTMPERRALRYALISGAEMAKTPPSEADIARFYQANQASYAAVQKRKIAQIILQDQDKANAFMAKVKGGTSFTKAATAEGFERSDVELGEQTRKSFADKAPATIVNAAFSAAEGALIGPVKTDFGWSVVQVQSIDNTPARTLADVHDEISASLGKQQADERLADLVNKLQDSLGDGASFDDTVRAQHLTASETPAITADGRDPEQKDYQLPIIVRPLLKPGFDATPGDHPTVETIGAGQTYAMLAVGRVIPAAPIPLAKLRDRVTADFAAFKASARAETVAKGIVAKVNGGASMSSAFSDAKLPEPQKMGGRRDQLARNGAQVPPAMAFLFTLPAGATRALPAPNGMGWLVIHVGKVTPGDPKANPELLAGARSQLSPPLAEEYAAQFANAVAASVKISRDDRAIAQLKAQLAGAAPAEQ